MLHFNSLSERLSNEISRDYLDEAGGRFKAIRDKCVSRFPSEKQNLFHLVCDHTQTHNVISKTVLVLHCYQFPTFREYYRNIVT